MTKRNRDNLIAKRFLDFILITSMLSAVVIWSLIQFDKISDSNIKYVFMPGWVLMFVILALARISMIDIHDNEEDKK